MFFILLQFSKKSKIKCKDVVFWFSGQFGMVNLGQTPINRLWQIWDRPSNKEDLSQIDLFYSILVRIF